MGVAGVRRVAVWSISLRQLLFFRRVPEASVCIRTFPSSLTVILSLSHFPALSSSEINWPARVSRLLSDDKLELKCLQSICFLILLRVVVHWQTFKPNTCTLRQQKKQNASYARSVSWVIKNRIHQIIVITEKPDIQFYICMNDSSTQK